MSRSPAPGRVASGPMRSLRPQPVHVALIGAGQMGSLHARVVSQNPDASLACVVDPAESNGAPLADRFESRWVPALSDFGPFDAVIVASPTAYHLEWAQLALSAGKPTLIEKPVAEQLGAVLSVLSKAQQAGIPLMCSFPERFNPAVRTLLDIVEEPIHITAARHSPFIARIPHGVASDLLIHDVDLVLKMSGALPIGINAHFGAAHPKSDPMSEDVAEASLLFESGLVASLSASRVSQRKLRRIEVAELDRLIEVDLIRQDITVYRHVGADFLEGASTGYRQQTVIDIPAIQYGREPLAAQLDHFLNLVRGDGDAPGELSTIADPHRVISSIIEKSNEAPSELDLVPKEVDLSAEEQQAESR
jgi:predicted dehydrogenase